MYITQVFRVPRPLVAGQSPMCTASDALAAGLPARGLCLPTIRKADALLNSLKALRIQRRTILPVQAKEPLYSMPFKPGQEGRGQPSTVPPASHSSQSSGSHGHLREPLACETSPFSGHWLGALSASSRIPCSVTCQESANSIHCKI